MNIQDYTPERICEALCWLYGEEWKEAEEHSFGRPFVNINKDHEVLVMRTGNCVRFYNHQHHYSTVITGRISHALTVTEPWEWNGRYAKLPAGNGEACWFRVGTEEGEDRFHWSLTLTDGPNMEEFEQDEAAAKSAARDAYLTWMRGRLTLRGLEK